MAQNGRQPDSDLTGTGAWWAADCAHRPGFALAITSDRWCGQVGGREPGRDWAETAQQEDDLVGWHRPDQPVGDPEMFESGLTGRFASIPHPDQRDPQPGSLSEKRRRQPRCRLIDRQEMKPGFERSAFITHHDDIDVGDMIRCVRMQRSRPPTRREHDPDPQPLHGQPPAVEVATASETVVAGAGGRVVTGVAPVERTIISLPDSIVAANANA